MPGLRTLRLRDHYRSDNEDVVSDFFVPAFRVASTYDRAVGYFSSGSLALYARGITEFASRGGMMRLIASPVLSEDDVADIQRGYDIREILARAVLSELSPDQPDVTLDGLGVVGRLVAAGLLDIKLAFVKRGDQIGVYHEKIGVFRDGCGDIVAFNGSSNETFGGLMANFEAVEVYRGWTEGEGSRALRLEDDFNALWQDKTPHLSVEPFPDVAKDRLIQLGNERIDDQWQPRHHTDPRVDSAGGSPSSRMLAFPVNLELRKYQREAVEAWLGNQGRGIFKMATGTGKTKTALICATQLANLYKQRDTPLIVLVIAPFQHLVDQWIEEVQEFGVFPVGVYESSQIWVPRVEEQLTECRMGRRPVVVLVATNKSFAGDKFQSILARINYPFLVIADEAHNLGSSTYRSSLPPNATYRLALSATPERWFDDDGTDALLNYFGPVVYEIGLGKAIELGALCRYEYHPRLIELDSPETDLYIFSRIISLTVVSQGLVGGSVSRLVDVGGVGLVDRSVPVAGVDLGAWTNEQCRRRRGRRSLSLTPRARREVRSRGCAKSLASPVRRFTKSGSRRPRARTIRVPRYCRRSRGPLLIRA